MFFESVKSELRNGTSEYSDISDSEESEPDCTNQVNGRVLWVVVKSIEMQEQRFPGQT